MELGQTLLLEKAHLLKLQTILKDVGQNMKWMLWNF